MPEWSTCKAGSQERGEKSVLFGVPCSVVVSEACGDSGSSSAGPERVARHRGALWSTGGFCEIFSGRSGSGLSFSFLPEGRHHELTGPSNPPARCCGEQPRTLGKRIPCVRGNGRTPPRGGGVRAAPTGTAGGKGARVRSRAALGRVLGGVFRNTLTALSAAGVTDSTNTEKLTGPRSPEGKLRSSCRNRAGKRPVPRAEGGQRRGEQQEAVGRVEAEERVPPRSRPRGRGPLGAGVERSARGAVPLPFRNTPPPAPTPVRWASPGSPLAFSAGLAYFGKRFHKKGGTTHG